MENPRKNFGISRKKHLRFSRQKKNVFSYRPESGENHRSPRVGFPRHPRNGSYLVENEGQQKMMQDESQRNTGVGVHAVVIVTSSFGKVSWVDFT